jgi:hypothetical protein
MIITYQNWKISIANFDDYFCVNCEMFITLNAYLHCTNCNKENNSCKTNLSLSTKTYETYIQNHFRNKKLKRILNAN